jgi:tryptophanase
LCEMPASRTRSSGVCCEMSHEPPRRRLELVRLAIPRRVFSNSHLDYVAEVLEHIRDHRHELRGFRMTHAPKVLRHFTARFEELVEEPVAVA